jgi:DNA-directed RNA polymerase subunit L
MDPKIQNLMDDDGILRFTLLEVNVSIANALRRTILSDINTIVFKTSPHEENKSVFLINTTRLNNEILKQRLSCIPIYLNHIKIDNIENLKLEVNVENDTEEIKYVSTKDFKIIDIETDKQFNEQTLKIIFPPWIAPNGSEHYIEFARLRPKISDTIPGEKLHFTCTFSESCAKENSMFNCVSTCSYGFTPDVELQHVELDKKKREWIEKGIPEEKISLEERNWYLLEGQRCVKENSFDFIIQTIGVYDNKELIVLACDNLIKRLNTVKENLEKNEELIKDSENTMQNCYDFILENEDYTIGKIIEYALYFNLFESEKTLSFCGFKKTHPHNTFSIIRMAYFEQTIKEVIKQNLIQCIDFSISIIEKIKIKFQKK